MAASSGDFGKPGLPNRKRDPMNGEAACSWHNPKGPKAPIAWYGGKYYLAEWIISHFPDHRVYVEPFGGMANVLLKKRPSEVEIFNDLDGRVMNFFRVLRDPDRLQELKRRCELTPYSREEFSALCTTPEPEDEIDRAWWFFVRCRQARGGIGMSAITANAWAMSSRTRRQMPEPVSKYLAAIDGLDTVATRFRMTVIEHLPAIEVIRKYDGKDVLLYCDPPYPGSTRHGGKAATYGVEMGDVDHEQLLAALTSCQGRVVLSSYESPLYSSALANWSKAEKATHVQFSNSGGARNEVLWLNW
jgi:DNA adenine methylase